MNVYVVSYRHNDEDRVIDSVWSSYEAAEHHRNGLEVTIPEVDVEEVEVDGELDEGT
jgi:hypothetical protein